MVLAHFPALSETFILNRITGLIKRGHEVDIYAGSARDSDPDVHKDVVKYGLAKNTFYESAGVQPIERLIRILTVPVKFLMRARTQALISMRPDKKTVRRLSRFKERKQYDVIHAFFGTNGNLALKARQLNLIGGPLAVSFHGFDLGRELKKDPNVYRDLFNEAELIMPVCKYYKDRLEEAGCPADKIRVHPSAIDADYFTPSNLGNDPEYFRILSIGRLVEKKGFEYGIKAVNQLISKYPDRKIEYRIVGEGPLKSKFQELIKEKGAQENIRILSLRTQDEIRREIRKSQLLICPSVLSSDGDVDTVPNVLKEAMACGLPVIASDLSGIPELVKDGVNGFLTEPNNAKAIADGMEILLNSADLRRRFGSEGRQTVIENYNIEYWNDIASNLYAEIAKTSNVP